MKICKTLLTVGLAFLLSGCHIDNDNPFVPSLRPLFAKVDLDLDPRLVGTFSDEKGEVTFAFKEQGDTAYQLTVKEEEGGEEASGVFEAHLVRLGGFWFLDFYPEPPQVGDDFYKFHLMRAHTFARISIENDAVRLRFLRSEWLKKRMEDKSVEIDHQEVDDDILLTASTTELQNLLFRYASDDKAFGEALELHRAKDCENPEGCKHEDRTP